MTLGKLNAGFLWGVAATGLALILSILRDVYLSEKLSEISIFVSYISLCALITTPFGERMQYGFSFKLSKARTLCIVFSGFVAAAIVSLVLKAGYFMAAFCLGLTFNILYCLVIASMISDLTSNTGAIHLIRLIGPIFPLANIFFVWAGLTEVISLVNYSYIVTLVIVTGWYLYCRKEKSDTLSTKKDTFFTKSFLYHYLSFFVAYLFVLLNLELGHENSKIYELRLPIYIYSLSSFILPYYGYKLRPNKPVYLAAPFISAAFLFLINIIIDGYWLVTIMSESILIFILAYLSYYKTVKR